MGLGSKSVRELPDPGDRGRSGRPCFVFGRKRGSGGINFLWTESKLTLDILTFRVNIRLQIMIKSFKCKETEKIYNREPSRKLPLEMQRVAYRKLWYLGAAQVLEDLRVPPGNRLEALSGDRQSQFSIRINDQFRICFVWNGNDAHEVEIVDYH